MPHAFAEPMMERVVRRALSLNEAGVAPEDIFVAWLVGLPQGADVSRAATQLVARLDAAEVPGRSDDRLRDLLVEVAQSDVVCVGTRNRGRNRWRN